MSKVAFINVPAHGHVNPTLGLVRELVQRGETVTYYTTDPFREAIEATGASFRTYSPLVDDDLLCPFTNLFRVSACVLEVSRAVLPHLLPELQADPPDYVIHDALCPFGKVIARVLDVPAIASFPIFAFTAPVVLSSPWFVGQIARDVIAGRSLVAQSIRLAAEIRGKYGVGWPWMVRAFHNSEALNLVYTSREFHPRGSSLDERYALVGPCLTSRPRSSDFHLEALDGPSVLLLSMATIQTDCPDLYRTCLEAFGDSTMRVVMATGHEIDPASLGRVPDNFLMFPYVPQLEVLERAGVFVTHGGMNSVHEAIANHVPLVVVPQTMEQACVGRRVHQAGAGLCLKTPRPTAEALRRAVEAVRSDPRYHTNAQSLAETFTRAGGARKAVDKVFAYKHAHSVS